MNPPGNKRPQRPTIKDIARELNLSFSTVSRILSGSALFNENTVNRVYAKAHELNYTPNIMARGLVKKGNSLIGLVLRDVEQSFFASIIEAAQSEVEAEGFSIILCNSSHDLSREKKHLNVLVDKFVEGIIITPITNERHNATAYNKVIEQHLPLIMIGNPKIDVQAPYVKVDNSLGAEIATRHLLDLGHRSLVYLTFNQEELSSHKRHFNNENIERYQGFMRAMQQFDLQNRAFTLQTNDSEPTEETIQQLIELSPRPTGIFAYSDLIAANMIRQLHARGYHVPGDFSIIGFDDLEYARMITPALTTVAQPKKQLGSQAARNLIEMIRGREVTDQILKPELIVRASTAAPR